MKFYFICVFILITVFIFMYSYSWGSRDGAVVRALPSDQCGPGSIPRLSIMPIICGLSLLLVLVLALRVFPTGTPVFPLSLKTNVSKFQFNLEFKGHRFVSHIRLLSVASLNKVNFFLKYQTVFLSSVII